MTPPENQLRVHRTVLLLGIATAIAQALVLREAMAAVGGSELAWGVVMAVWLGGMAIGARIGVAVGRERVARLLPVAVLGLAAVGVLLLRAAPALVGAAPGENLTTVSAAWVWLAAVVPAAAAGGAAFPILAAELGPTGGGRAYTWEAAGALLGGTVLTIALVFFGTVSTLCVTGAAVAALAVLPHSRGAAALLLVGGLLVSAPAADWVARASWHWADRPGTLGDWLETRHQQLAVSAGTPTTVWADGDLLASYPDPYTVLPRAHLLMLLHPDPDRVFAVGCAASGAVEAMVQHPAELVRVVEDDPDLLRRLPEWYGRRAAAALTRPGVEMVAADPLRAVATDLPWDLVLLLDGDPTTLRRNRTRSLEFLRRCRSQMAEDGVLVMKVGVSDTYLGGAAGRLLTVLASTLADVFPTVAAIPGESVLLVAGGPDSRLSLDSAVLASRLASRQLQSAELVPEMIPLLLDRDRAAELRRRLARDAEPNTTRRPRAVLLASGLHEGRGRPTLVRLVRTLEAAGRRPLAVAMAVAALALLAMCLAPSVAAPAAACVVGFCSMGWWLLLLAIWQAGRGSVYSEIGALTALFMAGLAAGGGVASRWAQPARRLPILLSAGVVLSLVIAAGIVVAVPAAPVTLLLAAGGGLTGLAFPGLATLGARGVRRGAGVAFAADEAGAAIAALTVGIFLIPWAGLATTAAGLAVLQLTIIPAVVRALRTTHG